MVRIFCSLKLTHSKGNGTDLYGNDEAENEQPHEEAEILEAAEELTEATAVKTETQETPLSSVPATTEKSFANAHPSTPSAPIPSYTQPPPQQIPTYEQAPTNEYRETPPIRTDGAYQSAASSERSVRPSEMKDEG